jgi:copper(I)-binding protein
MRSTSLLSAAALFLLAQAPTAFAQQAAPGPIEVTQAWSRATPGGAPVGAGYLALTNRGAEADRLIGGSTEIAGRIEVHEMSMDNGVMKMRELAGGLEVKPGQTVALKPGGHHLMLMGLKRGLKEGERFKVQLEFAKSGKTEVEFVVQGMGASAAPGAAPSPAGRNHHHH